MSTIAALVGKGFEDVEYTKPAEAFRNAGHTVTVVGKAAGEEVTGKHGTAVRVERSAAEIKPERFDALFIPGGHSPDNLRIDPAVVGFVREFVESGKPVFAICHAPQLLITAKVIKGRRVALGAMDFDFLGGSMGSVIGEKLALLVERATTDKLPLIIVCMSGGARMHEGALSLMQMAKVSAALARFDQAGGLYITVLTDPTTGGTTASFAMLADVTIAEPKALIGFAGPRTIWNTIKVELPEGFQRSEFLQDHGFIDFVVPRKDLRSELARLIDFCVK
jgi:PfpI family intracellular protease